jgi:hypothetical protein
MPRYHRRAHREHSRAQQGFVPRRPRPEIPLKQKWAASGHALKQKFPNRNEGESV